MADIAIILALVILNALIMGAFQRWRGPRAKRGTLRQASRRPLMHYPIHPSPGTGAWSLVPESKDCAEIRPAGIDW